MGIVDLSVKELIKKIDKKEITPYEIYKAYMNNIIADDKEIGAFLSLNKFEEYSGNNNGDNGDNKENEKEYNSKYSIPIAIKDNIAVKNLPLTASSKILENYISPYDASVIESLKENNLYIIGKTNLDEFASGGATQNSKIIKTSNPRDLDKIPGGSSGGSAAAVSARFAPWALGTDTGGSVRQPAAYCGVVGFKPSSGIVSKYGVIPLKSSFDHIGTITKTVEDVALLLDMIASKSEEDKDPNVVILNKDYSKEIKNDIKGKKIGLIKELYELSSGNVKEKMNRAIKVFENLGMMVEEISLPYLEEISSIYVTLGYAEASSNLERYDGVRFGLRSNEDSYEKMIIKTRTKGLGYEVKKRILLGSYVLKAENYNKYYLKAAKARRKIVEYINSLFETYDVLIAPTIPDIAPDKDNISNTDHYTIFANLAGIPAISIPIEKDDSLPIGLHIIGPQFKDELVLNFANIYEKNI